MTAIFYPDCQAESPDGRFALEARSPHNGTIPHQDGSPPSEEEFGFKYREHQNHFRYRLLNQDRRVVWDRWQVKFEDSPHELVVSNDGWSILRTHGFRPEVIVVAPSGKDILRVRISDSNESYHTPSAGVEVHSWSPTHLACSTAGLDWSGDSWRYFLHHQGRPYFVWRSSWGQRLVIDLERAVVRSDADPANHLLALALVKQEKKGVSDLLAALSPRMAEVRKLLARNNSEDRERHPLTEKLRLVRSALHLAGVHRIKVCVPFLREWDELDVAGMSTGSGPWGDGWLEVQHFRPILHHSLRLLGEVPHGLPTYYFTNGDQRFPVPQRIAVQRARSQLDRGMSAKQVLQLLGSPDHVTRRSHRVGSLFEWTEDWEYDFRVGTTWTTLRITWKEENRKGLITNIEEMPSPWLQSNERESEILSY